MDLINFILGENGQKYIDSIIESIKDEKTKIVASEKIKEYTKFLKEKEEEFQESEFLSLPIIVNIFKHGGSDKFRNDDLLNFIIKEKNNFYEKYSEKAKEIGADIEGEFVSYVASLFSDGYWESKTPLLK